ncbi:hypothetical protein F5Y07DRAFT_361828 [Xylaria sp. FL0933]|nr:hypothetical protein F5Y07DRAFT_361828 [Xylaria sp. FL0933]
MSTGNFIACSSVKESFDRATGQTFLQWDVPVPEPMPVPWNRVPHSNSYSQSPSPPLLGAPSLVDICSKVAAQHIEELDESHLQDLPTPLVARIWESVKKTEKYSVETWKLLATILTTRVRNEKGMGRHIDGKLMCHSIQVPQTQPLVTYIKPLTSDTLDFLTHVVIAGNVSGWTTELLQLYQLKNLAVLEIFSPNLNKWDNTDTFPKLTDSVVREWSRTPGVFPFLRILRVWGEDHTTRDSLRYICAFPSLVVYDIAGKKRHWARKHYNFEVPAWKPTRWTWTTDAKQNAFRHFGLFNSSLSDDESRIRGRRLRIPESSHLGSARGFQEANKALKKFEDYLLDHGQMWFSLGAKAMCDLEESESRQTGFWGFLMYCYIGMVLANRDLSEQGLDIGQRTPTTKETELPPRPMINVMLGSEHPAYSDPKKSNKSFEKTAYEKQITFVRHRHLDEIKETSGAKTGAGKAVKRSLDHSTPINRPLKKRQDAATILESFHTGPRATIWRR